jgi:multisubunit Na+/H+ antiporter MnhF subunit
VSLTLNASEKEAHVGDSITLSGTVTGIKTIAVYLFVIGPDLDNRGVTLDNLNIPAGHGLFTTAPVHMDDGTWSYTWDTAVILGNLKPGTYTIYVVSSPVDRLRFVKGEYTTTEIVFLPSEEPTSELPLGPCIPIVALVISGGVFLGYTRMRRE